MQIRLSVVNADWHSSAIVLPAVSGRSAAGPPAPRVSRMFPPREKLYRHEN